MDHARPAIKKSRVYNNLLLMMKIRKNDALIYKEKEAMEKHKKSPKQSTSYENRVMNLSGGPRGIL